MVQFEGHIGEKTTIENGYRIARFENVLKYLAGAIRDHWTGEKQLHWVLDTAFPVSFSLAKSVDVV